MTLQIVNHYYSKLQHQEHNESDHNTASLHSQNHSNKWAPNRQKKRHLLLAEEYVIVHRTNMKGGFTANS